MPFFIKCLKVATINLDVRLILTGQDRVRLRTGCDQDRSCWKRHHLVAREEFPSRLVEFLLPQDQGAGCAEWVDLDFLRGEAFREMNAFLHRFGDFLVIEGVARRINHASTISHRHASPGVEKIDQVRWSPFLRSSCTFCTDRSTVGEKLSRDLRFVRRPALIDKSLAQNFRELLITQQKLLDLNHIVGK